MKYLLIAYQKSAPEIWLYLNAVTTKSVASWLIDEKKKLQIEASDGARRYVTLLSVTEISESDFQALSEVL